MSDELIRTLGEIVDAVRDGQEATIDEMRYSICALDALLTFDSMALQKIAGDGKQAHLLASLAWPESFRRAKTAYETPPKNWVGWDNDPDNPEFLKRRAMSKRLLDKLAKDGETR